MSRKSNYWIDNQPPGTSRWQVAEHGTALESSTYHASIFKLYRRYVKQWNDIELDTSRSLSEHTHRVCGAHVVGSSGKFILSLDINRETGWILEVVFVRNFRQYHPGLSCGLNALRSIADIKRVVLHWRGVGKQAFETWLVQESKENDSLGEWSEYKQ